MRERYHESHIRVALLQPSRVPDREAADDDQARPGTTDCLGLPQGNTAAK